MSNFGLVVISPRADGNIWREMPTPPHKGYVCLLGGELRGVRIMFGSEPLEAYAAPRTCVRRRGLRSKSGLRMSPGLECIYIYIIY